MIGVKTEHSHVCSRCDETLTRPGPADHVEGWTDVTLRTYFKKQSAEYPWGTTLQNHHLCPRCLREFESWMKALELSAWADV